MITIERGDEAMNLKSRLLATMANHATMLLLAAVPKDSRIRRLFADRAGNVPSLDRSSARAGALCLYKACVATIVAAIVLAGVSGAWGVLTQSRTAEPDGWIKGGARVEASADVKLVAWVAKVACAKISCSREVFDVVDLGAEPALAVGKLSKELPETRYGDRSNALVRWQDGGQARAMFIGSPSEVRSTEAFIKMRLSEETARLSKAGAMGLVSAMDAALARGATEEQALAAGRAARQEITSAGETQGLASVAKAFSKKRTLSISMSSMRYWVEASGKDVRPGSDGFAAQQFAAHVLAIKASGIWTLVAGLIAGALFLLIRAASAWQKAVDENVSALTAVTEYMGLCLTSRGRGGAKSQSKARRI